MSDLIERRAAIDALEKSRFPGAPYIDTGIQIALREIKALESAQPEPCEDAVSRQRLLSDLKELTAAWGKYPVMAEQIKGVEAAIGYVETIPSVKPEREKGKWIPCSERLPEYGKTVLWCNDKGSIFTTAITYMNGTSWAVGKRHRRCQVVAWMPLPEPYGGDQNG